MDLQETEVPRLLKIRAGLYETTYRGHHVQVERITEVDAEVYRADTGWWTFYIDESQPAEPWPTMTSAYECARKSIDATEGMGGGENQ